MNRIILFLLFAFFYIHGYSGTIDPNVPDEKYIQYGTKFPYVLQLEGTNKDNYIVLGSCVIVDKKWIITAAHVAKEMTTCRVLYDNTKIHINRMIIHKDFDDAKFGLADIALGQLEQEIILDFYPELYGDSDEPNSQCSIVGFGFGGTFETGSKFSDSKKRAGLNLIDKIENDLLICSPSINKKTSLEFLITHGDSGGGLFINNKLAGINSCVMTTDNKPNSSYGDESGHTRISKYKPWILENINEYKK